MKIALCAGEPSGDEHAASVLNALRALQPDCTVRGMGLRHLREAGMEMVDASARAAAVMGFTEAVAGARAVAGAYKAMTKLLAEWQPAVLIIVNYSDFNLRLAGEAKKRRIPVLFFIPPQVWAWRASRVKTIDERVDAAAVIFPFEREFYESRGCKKAVFVGHPFCDRYPGRRLDDAARRRFRTEHGLSPDRPLGLLFPGSRKGELKRHLPLVLEAAALLRARRPEVQLVMNAACEEDRTAMQAALAERKITVPVLLEDSFTLMQCGDAGLIKSGTSNLQAAFSGLPFSMYFTLGALSAFIVRKFVKVKEYSIVNILRPRTVREIVQEAATPDALASELENLLENTERRDALKKGFAEVAEILSRHDEHPAFEGARTASERTAKLALSLAR